MAVPGSRACSWAAVAKAVCERRLAEGAGGSPSPEPASLRAALYVHWPYCEKRCSYCNFNKYIPRGLQEAAMRSCLVTEAQTLLRLSGVHRVESVFFGGGTPSLASPHTVAAVLEAVSQATHLPADSEVTLEANPTSAPGSKLAAFGAAGVNRLSIGLQSLDDHELQLLGRTHSARDALRTLAEARRLFPGRVSVDLMLGLPAQQVGPWVRQLRELLHHCDDHLSLYQLTLERGTALFTQVQQGTLPAPDPELAAEMYQQGRAMLREAGFRQYEVSNFARNAGGSLGHGATHRCGGHSPALAAVRAPTDPVGRVWSKQGGEGAAGSGPVAAGSQGSSVFLEWSCCAGLSIVDPPASTPRGLASDIPLPCARRMMTRWSCIPGQCQLGFGGLAQHCRHLF
ncbi:radical S-adenosyl methionine domain-containing protein 1, mitochondrial isoform X2 [Tupaia chinensis]|uniref:radical S-adenosyl methionine domain-containing protein 1, mitochondrial isoform X2 n=1 Tax=Tupaia chinensis TaxID=246437 RepID=UPI0003C90235|nr:radical S-adenosyl methionine domain-containing protein 1, mitochondrial isoform X2 [Tupaia chinensis]